MLILDSRLFSVDLRQQVGLVLFRDEAAPCVVLDLSASNLGERNGSVIAALLPGQSDMVVLRFVAGIRPGRLANRHVVLLGRWWRLLIGWRLRLFVRGVSRGELANLDFVGLHLVQLHSATLGVLREKFQENGFGGCDGCNLGDPAHFFERPIDWEFHAHDAPENADNRSLESCGKDLFVVGWFLCLDDLGVNLPKEITTGITTDDPMSDVTLNLAFRDHRIFIVILAGLDENRRWNRGYHCWHPGCFRGWEHRRCPFFLTVLVAAILPVRGAAAEMWIPAGRSICSGLGDLRVDERPDLRTNLQGVPHGDGVSMQAFESLKEFIAFTTRVFSGDPIKELLPRPHGCLSPVGLVLGVLMRQDGFRADCEIRVRVRAEP